ncbi:MAG: glycosyltransferase [bacterium]|nr:glycosyltransferase [bacterium]
MNKIIYASENPPTGLLNGVTTAVTNMRKALGLTDADYIYICPNKPKNKPQENVYELPSLGLSARWIPSWLATIDEGYRFALPYSFPLLGKAINRRLTSYLKNIQPCYPHIQGTQLTGEQVAMACLKANIPYILTLHTYDEHYLDDRIHISLLRNFMKKNQAKRSRYVADHAATVTCASLWYEKRYRDFTGYTGKIIIIPSIVWPFDLMNSQEKELEEHNFRTNELPSESRHRPLIGAFGRKSPEKNLDFAIEIMAQINLLCNNKKVIKEKRPLLVVIGPGAQGYEDLLKKLATKKEVINDILFLPAKPNEQLLKVSQFITVQIFTSLTETQGLIRVEAQLAQSVPLVMENTALAENLDNPKLILPPQPQIWASTILKLLDDPHHLRETARKQRDIALKQNDPNTYKRRLMELYQNIQNKL